MFTLCQLFFIVVTFGDAMAYHQSDYAVKLHRAEITSYNHSYLKDLHGGYVLYNRTQRVFSGSGHLLKELNSALKGFLQVYKLMSNEYRFFPITMHFDNICADISVDPFGIKQSFEKNLNHEIRCPFKPGFYKLVNAVVDFSKFPPFIPSGDYKMELKFYMGNDFLAEGHVYGKVEEILKLWGNLN